MNKQKYIFYLFYILFLTSCTTKFENFKNNDILIPIVEKQIGDKYYNFIIDSGSNVSIIDYAFYSNNKDLFNVHDSVYISLGDISNINKINTIIVYTKISDINSVFFVADITPLYMTTFKYGYDIIGILGADYLNDNNVIIDYKNKRIKY